MDHPVNWSPEATEDLESIAAYIARDSDFYARAIVSKILAVSGKIPEQPLLGRVVPEMGDEEIRELFVYSYRLVYRVQGREITVLAVIHGKRLLENISERF
ncbi:MAG: type II toxin-antitoxin system RelE/ParE family toxin [Rhodothermia bacterium]